MLRRFAEIGFDWIENVESGYSLPFQRFILGGVLFSRYSNAELTEASCGFHEDMRSREDRVWVHPFHRLMSTCTSWSIIHRRNASGGEQGRIHPVAHSRNFGDLTGHCTCCFAETSGDSAVCIAAQRRAFEQVSNLCALVRTSDHFSQFLNDFFSRLAWKGPSLNLE